MSSWAFKLAASIFLLGSLFHYSAFAHKSDQITTPEQICAHLMENFTGGVLISRTGVGFSPRQVSLPKKNSQNPYLALMVQLPFGGDIMNDFPAFFDLAWQKWDIYISALTKTKSNRKVDITISHQGFLEIKIGSNSYTDDDKIYYERIIGLLRKSNVDAMLYARSSIVPFDPIDGFELWVSRLDLNSTTTRAGLTKLLNFLNEN